MMASASASARAEARAECNLGDDLESDELRWDQMANALHDDDEGEDVRRRSRC
eukprot:m.356773 g.356773  ORF g.356773 m.356773 type:complete len:53 (-) comp16607_c0_seq7:1088-1246(-)